jgi:dihydroorotate dehydrogenase electron transfer subunit
MKENKATILSNRKAGSDFYELKLKLAHPVKKTLPGQFCMLSIGDASRILRRPFGIFKQPSQNRISILYRLSGEGTRSLASQKKGTILSILLPLGNGYPLTGLKGKTLYIVAGGIGLASVFPLLDVKSAKKKFFYGAKTKSELYRFRRDRRARWFVGTDDGSQGLPGSINIAVEKELQKDIRLTGPNKIVVMACGPDGMLKNLKARIRSLSGDVKTYFSVEERMACGLGVCMGCVVKSEGQLKCSCKEGPVFDADKLEL